MAMLFGSLLATIIFLIFRSHNPALDIYTPGILGVFALTFFRYLYSSLFSPKRVETIPSLKEQGILDIAMENAMLFLIIFFAIIISLQSAGNYQFFFMALAGILVAAHLLDYGIRIRNDRRAGTTSPHRKIYFLIPLLRDGLLLWCSLTFTFFIVEVLPAISHFQPVTLSTLIIMSVLIVSSYLFFRIYRRLWFGNWHDRFLVRTMVPGYVHRLGRFLLDICLRYFGYVLALISLNGAVALTLLLVWNDIIQLDLSHANGFVLFLMFTAGNFLIICVWVLRESERL